MNKITITRSLFVLAATAFTTLVSATVDLEVTGVQVSGAQISVALHNPTSVDETAHLRVTVSVAGGGVETLESNIATFAAGTTQTVTLTASHPIVAITDDPQPVND